MRYRELGHSTLGAPMIALVIWSTQTLRALDRYRELNQRLADPRGFKTAKEADDVLHSGKVIVLITSGIHSTEVGGHLSPAVLAYRLASDTSAVTRAILDNVILWLVPSLHPPRRPLGPPWDHRPPRPPPQGAHTPHAHHHGVARLVSRAAARPLASRPAPPADQLATRARGFNPRERSWNFTNPWPGGRWTLRDIVTYQTDGAYALLENAARYRDRWLANFLTIEGRAVRGWKGWPYAYVLPRQHHDSVGLATLLGILHRGEGEGRTALHPVAVGTPRVPAGRHV